MSERDLVIDAIKAVDKAAALARTVEEWCLVANTLKDIEHLRVRKGSARTPAKRGRTTGSKATAKTSEPKKSIWGEDTL